MKLDIGAHLHEDELEQYSMGTLPGDRVGPFEEHFMVCETCQDHLLEMEAYVNAVRSVSPTLRQATPWHWKALRSWPSWVGLAASIAAIFLIGRLWLAAAVPGPPVAVFLQATRGIEGLSIATAAAGRPLSLQIDPIEILTSLSYRLEIVNSSGNSVSDGRAISQNGRIVQTLPKGLSAGKYYVRLYSAAGELLREYGLQIR